MVLAQSEQGWPVQVARGGHAHAVAADADVYGGNVLPEVAAVDWDEVLGGVGEQLFFACFEQPAADVLRAFVVEGGVGGEDGVFGFGGADELVGGHDVAEALRAVHYVVPRQFAAFHFAGEAVEHEIAHQPGGVGGQVRREAVALGLGDDAGGNHQGHGADNVLGADEGGVAALVVAQDNGNIVIGFADVQGGGVDGGGLGKGELGGFR